MLVLDLSTEFSTDPRGVSRSRFNTPFEVMHHSPPKGWKVGFWVKVTLGEVTHPPKMSGLEEDAEVEGGCDPDILGGGGVPKFEGWVEGHSNIG